MMEMDKPRLPMIELLSSSRLAWLFGVVHLGALVLLLTLPLAWWALVGVAALLVVSALHNIKRHALRRGARAVTALEFSDREQLRLRTGDGLWHDGRLLGTSTVGASLAVLNIRLDGQGMQHVIITSDGMDGGDFRRLRVWLRWGPRPAVTDAEWS